MVTANEYTSRSLVGTPDSIADQMGEAMDAVGGDGFLLIGPTGERRATT